MQQEQPEALTISDQPGNRFCARIRYFVLTQIEKFYSTTENKGFDKVASDRVSYLVLLQLQPLDD